MNTNIDSKKKETKLCSFSVNEDIHGRYMRILTEVNEMGGEHRKCLKKLSINDLLESMAIYMDDKFKGHLKSIRLTGTAKMELYKKRYEKLHGNISDDQWADLIMSSDFQKFKKENLDCLSIY